MGIAPANHFLAKNSPKIELIFNRFMTARACKKQLSSPESARWTDRNPHLRKLPVKVECQSDL